MRGIGPSLTGAANGCVAVAFKLLLIMLLFALTAAIFG